MTVPVQILRYLLVGLTALLLDVGCFMLLRTWSVDLVAANLAARAVGALSAFAGNYAWTFIASRALSAVQRSAWRYALWWVVATSASTLLLPAVIPLLPHEALAKLVLELLMVVLNFIAARMWIYAQGK